MEPEILWEFPRPPYRGLPAIGFWEDPEAAHYAENPSATDSSFSKLMTLGGGGYSTEGWKGDRGSQASGCQEVYMGSCKVYAPSPVTAQLCKFRQVI